MTADVALEAYVEAHARYQGFRDAALQIGWEIWSRIAGEDLKLFPIDASALKTVELVWRTTAHHPDGGFPWHDIFQQIRTTPRRFDIAIWHGQMLCGLATGMATRGNQSVTIKFLERWANPENPLKGRIAPIAVEVADNYAKILRKEYVTLKNPTAGAIPYYQTLGFSLAGRIKGSTYYGRKVQ